MAAATQLQAIADLVRGAIPFEGVQRHLLEMRQRGGAAGEKLQDQGFGALSPQEWLDLAEPVLGLGGGAGALTRQTGKVVGDLVVRHAGTKLAKKIMAGAGQREADKYALDIGIKSAVAEDVMRRVAPAVGLAAGGIGALELIPPPKKRQR